MHRMKFYWYWTVPPDKMHLSKPNNLLWRRKLPLWPSLSLMEPLKGGVVIGISDQFKIPVKYIGLGEGMEDLQVFRKNEFVDSLFGENA